MPLPRKITWQQGLSANPIKHPAEDVRLAHGGLWTPESQLDPMRVRSGVIWGSGSSASGTPCQVTAQTGQITVAPGRVLIQGAQALQGAYIGPIDVATARTLAAAVVGAGLPASGQFKAGRVIVRLYDQLYGDAQDNWDVEVHMGSAASTAATAPLPPVVPNTVELKQFTVTSAGVITLLGDTIYTAASGAPVPVTSSTRPTSPYLGMLVLEMDTGYQLQWDGTYWRFVKWLGAPTANTGKLHAGLATAGQIPNNNSDVPLGSWDSAGLNAFLQRLGTYNSGNNTFTLTNRGIYNIAGYAESDSAATGRSQVYCSLSNTAIGINGYPNGVHRGSGYAGSGYLQQGFATGAIFLEAGQQFQIRVYSFTSNSSTVSYSCYFGITLLG